MHQAEKTSKEIAGTTKFGLRTGKLEGHWRTIIFEEKMSLIGKKGVNLQGTIMIGLCSNGKRSCGQMK